MGGGGEGGGGPLEPVGPNSRQRVLGEFPKHPTCSTTLLFSTHIQDKLQELKEQKGKERTTKTTKCHPRPTLPSVIKEGKMNQNYRRNNAPCSCFKSHHSY